MNYQRIYDQLIYRARNRFLDRYSEKHHIIPRCLGGGNDENNIVSLTPEEHYVAHQLLVKLFPMSDALVYAARMMTVAGNGQIRSNKEYGWLKTRYNKICRARVGSKNPSYGRCWYHNILTEEAGKFLIKDVPKGWAKGRINTKKAKKKQQCNKCGDITCKRPDICRNGQRIKRFIESFGFDKALIGRPEFYDEYDRIVGQLIRDYQVDELSVEQIKQKYNIKLNETMRCILRSLDIERRDLSTAVKFINR